MARSVMPSQARFASVPRANIPRSTLDRSHGIKDTFDAGWLVPVFVDDVLPGDTLNLRMHAFARLATPLRPIMDNLFLESFFFFVPNRLVWSNWQRFCGEQVDPGDSTDYNIPRLADGTTVTTDSTYDHFGLPLGLSTTQERVNALPFRAYRLIYNEWFRDQNLQDSLTVLRDDGPDAANYSVMLRRGKRHDYFTSCLPWPQKDTLGAQTAPLTGEALVSTHALESEILRIEAPDIGSGVDRNMVLNTGQLAVGTVETIPDDQALYADLATASAGIDINALRLAFQLQKMAERDARGGTRYTEIILAHFGVTSPDARLQRPEYLGGGSSRVNISPVPQTSESGTTAQGTLAAFGTVNASGHGFVKSFTEHGWVIGLVSVRADLTYQQGLARMWSRVTREDHYWPALAQIGEQAVLQKEIFIAGDATDDDVFGYQERYAEYRYKPSEIRGLFRSAAAGSLDIWHLSQEFSSAPTLSPSFIVENPPIDRVIAVPSEPHFLFDAYFDYKCARPMPVYGVPGLMDHF